MPEPPRERQSRSTVRDFQIRRTIGRGSFGCVYKVIRRSDNQEYALKEVNISSLNQREREDAVNEVRILASINHPNVLHYNECFLERDSLFIVTELAENGDLFSKIRSHKKKGRPFEEDLIWKYFIQLCVGVKALHHKNILHRDLKAQNIYLTENGNHIKIGDLGVAKLLKDRSMAHTQVGTPYYISPEIWKNKPYNTKSDVWALGCLLYELATFNHPFEANSVTQLIDRVMQGRYPSIPYQYSSELKTMIERILVIDQHRRPDIADILNSSIIQKRMHLVSSYTRSMSVSSEPTIELKGTIRVPRNLENLKLHLPGPRYRGDDDRCKTTPRERVHRDEGRHTERDPRRERDNSERRRSDRDRDHSERRRDPSEKRGSDARGRDREREREKRDRSHSHRDRENSDPNKVKLPSIGDGQKDSNRGRDGPRDERERRPSYPNAQDVRGGFPAALRPSQAYGGGAPYAGGYNPHYDNNGRDYYRRPVR